MDQGKASFTSIRKRHKEKKLNVGDFVSIVCKNDNTYIGKVLLINERFVTLLDTKGNVFAVWRSTIDSHLCKKLD
jgi:hypothetical protein